MPFRPSAAFAGAASLAVLCAAVLFAAVPAHAQKRPAMRGLPKGAKTDLPVLTRDQLRRCVTLEKQIDADNPDVRRREALMQAEAARIDKLESVLREWNEKIDDTNQAEIDNYNALVRQQKAWVDAHNASLPEYNDQLAKVKALLAEFNGDCAQRVYYDKDMDAIKRGK